MTYHLFRINGGKIGCKFLVMSEGMTIDTSKYLKRVSHNPERFTMENIGNITDGEFAFMKKVIPNQMLDIKE